MLTLLFRGKGETRIPGHGRYQAAAVLQAHGEFVFGDAGLDSPRFVKCASSAVAALIPFLHDSRFALLNEAHDFPKFVPSEAFVSRKTHRVHPELRSLPVSLNVHVRRFIEKVLCIE